ncbi:MAG: methyl-accepting chemotaxis protein [Magnetococcus sp. DMHC-6]
MKLQTKTQWIPTAVLVVIFLTIGLLFFFLMQNYSQKNHHNTLSHLIRSESQKMATVLEILTASQSPALAQQALQKGDVKPAQKIVQNLSSLGLSRVIFANKEAKPLYPEEAKLSSELTNLLLKERTVHVVELQHNIIAFAPILQDKSRIGFLLFFVEIPQTLQEMATHVLNDSDSSPLKSSSSPKITQHLTETQANTQADEKAMLSNIILILGVILIIGLGAIFFILRFVSLNILRPIQHITSSVDTISEGHLTHRIQIPTNPDEMYQLADHVNHMTDGLIRTVSLVRLQSETNQAISTGLRAATLHLKEESNFIQNIAHNTVSENDKVDNETRALVGQIEQISANMSAVKTSVDQLSQSIEATAIEAGNTSTNVYTVASAAEEMSANIEGVNENLDQVRQSVASVSTSLNELTKSFVGVRQRCQNATKETSYALQLVEENDRIMKNLADSAGKIGGVIEIINNIAKQTSLLSLNAAIEAAGAGDKGAGFAVVAGEVKDLARQTAEATREITRTIAEIQSHSQSAIQAVQGVSQGFERINLSNQEIANAVHAQDLTVRGIAKAMAGVSDATEEVTRNAQEMGLASQDVSRSAIEASQSTQQIALLATEAATAAQRLAQEGEEARKRMTEINELGQTILAAFIEVQKRGVRTLDRIQIINGWIGQSNMLTEVIHNTSIAMDQAINGFQIGTPPFDIQRVKMLHIQWLGNLKQDIHGGDRFDENVVMNHHECELGKWFDTQGKEQFGHLPLFTELGQVHQEIHTVGTQALQLGRRGEISAASDTFDKLNTIRAQLFEKLDQLYLEIVVQ